MKEKNITEFQKRVFNIVKKIPKGKTMTYKQIAEKLNSSPRAVGQALKHNPFPIKIPCHRVIKASGKFGGYTYKGKRKDKMKVKLLRKEKC